MTTQQTIETLKNGCDVDWVSSTEGRVAFQMAGIMARSLAKETKDEGFDHVRLAASNYDLRSTSSKTGLNPEEEICRCVAECIKAELTAIVLFTPAEAEEKPDEVAAWWREMAVALLGMPCAFDISGYSPELRDRCLAVIRGVDADRAVIEQ